MLGQPGPVPWKRCPPGTTDMASRHLLLLSQDRLCSTASRNQLVARMRRRPPARPVPISVAARFGPAAKAIGKAALCPVGRTATSTTGPSRRASATRYRSTACRPKDPIRRAGRPALVSTTIGARRPVPNGPKRQTLMARQSASLMPAPAGAESGGPGAGALIAWANKHLRPCALRPSASAALPAGPAPRVSAV